MREIEFRGKKIDTGEWVYGYYYNGVTTDEPFCIADCRIAHVIIVDGVMWHVDPKTVGQYTGLKGKHGEEIYEGDILEWLYAPGYEAGIASVIWSGRDGAWYIENDDANIFDVLYNVYDYSSVIGNIHENPELIATPTEKRREG